MSAVGVWLKEERERRRERKAKVTEYTLSWTEGGNFTHFHHPIALYFCVESCSPFDCNPLNDAVIFTMSPRLYLSSLCHIHCGGINPLESIPISYL